MITPLHDVHAALKDCGFAGNNDIYGLGVRLGIYLQWLTSILSENVYQADLDTTRAAGNCYQIAMIAGLIRVSKFPHDGVLALEAYIVLLFCFAGAWAASFALPGFGSKEKAEFEEQAEADVEAGRFGTLASLVLSTLTCAYGTWFLFVGITHMKRAPCNEIVFFFAPVHLFGWILHVLEAFFLGSLVGSTLLLVYRLYDLSVIIHETLRTAGEPSDSEERAPTQQMRITVRLGKTVASALALGLFVVSIELTLRWNHVRSVYTCDNFSQVFPLAIGASTLAKTVFSLGRGVVTGDISLSFRL
ncbi:hypothetical protein G7046_g2973 [Stylonectria norvegica]|nr:hypothetical protein G7046_g2973 [Stylonectria norvegica]